MRLLGNAGRGVAGLLRRGRHPRAGTDGRQRWGALYKPRPPWVLTLCRLVVRRTSPAGNRHEVTAAAVRRRHRILCVAGTAKFVWGTGDRERALCVSFHGSTPAGVSGWASPIRPSLFLFTYFFCKFCLNCKFVQIQVLLNSKSIQN
jgi:hypothetical protein